MTPCGSERGGGSPGDIQDRARSFGLLHGSALGPRNVRLRLAKIRELVPLEGDSLLDIGCGNGAYTGAMAPGFRHVDAIDVEPERLEVFRAHNNLPNTRIHQMSADNMEFADDSFNAITAIEVLEHVVDTAGVLREVFRTLKPGGWFALTTPNRLWPMEQHGYRLGSRWLPGWTFPGLVWLPPVHRRLSDADAFTVGQLNSLLRRSGLNPIGERYLFPPLDRFRDGHFLHGLMSGLEKSLFRVFSQTLVIVARK